MNRKERIFRFCKDVLPSAAGNLLILVFAFFSIYQFRLCARTGNPALVIPCVFLAMGAATVAALLLVMMGQLKKKAA